MTKQVINKGKHPYPTYNPIGLNIGDIILVSSKTEVDYVEIGGGEGMGVDWDSPPSKTEHKKQLIKTQFDPPLHCTVIGVAKKATGTFHPSSRHYSLDGDDYTPASLTVDKYHWLYEVRETIKSKPFLVHPNDIIGIKSTLPRRKTTSCLVSLTSLTNWESTSVKPESITTFAKDGLD